MKTPQVITLDSAFSQLTFFPNRTATSSHEETKGAFGQLSEYRDGGVFIGHYSGSSEWERHPNGDELVQVLAGATTLFLLEKGEECRHRLSAGQLLIVPRGVWHRFESPDGVKVLTVTPQPTQHSTAFPNTDLS